MESEWDFNVERWQTYREEGEYENPDWNGQDKGNLKLNGCKLYIDLTYFYTWNESIIFLL